MKLFRLSLLLLIISTTITSCKNENSFADIHIKPNTTLPIGTAVISDSTLFAMANVENQLFTDQNGVINFFVDGNYKAISQDNIDRVLPINFNPYEFAFNVPLPSVPVPYFPVPQPTVQAYYMNYTDGTVLDKLQLSNGTVKFTISNPSGLDFSKLICTIPQITKNGVPITLFPGQSITLDPTYIISPDQDGAFANCIELHLSGLMPYTSSLVGVVLIENPKLFHAEGYFGNKLVAQETVFIKPSDPAFHELTAKSSYVYFANPTIKFDVGNQLDIPVMLDISTLEIDGLPIILKSSLGDRKHLIAPKSHTKISISNASTVSGIALSGAITKNFESIKVGISSYINPSKSDIGSSYVPALKNTISNTDTLGVDYNVSLPFNCILDKLPFIQEIGINLSDMAQNNNTTYKLFQLRLNGTNELPVKVTLNPYVTADNNPNSSPIYLLDKPITIQPTASYLNPNSPGFVPFTITKEQPIIVDVVANKINSLLNAKKIFLSLTASTRNAEDHNPINCVNIYSPSKLKLDITIGAQADVNLSPSK